MKNRRIVSILLILVSLVAVLLLPTQVLAGSPAYPADRIYNLAAAPKPISDPSKAVPDSTSYLNQADPQNPNYDAKLQRYRTAPTAPLASTQQYVHSAWGSGIIGGTNVTGVYAGQAVRPNLNLPAVPAGGLTTWLYAPTLQLNNYCPIEAITVYASYPGGGYTDRFLGIQDHRTGDNFVKQWPIDATFVSNYVRTWQGPGQEYFVELLQSGSTYYVLLYNFNTGLWENKYTTSGGSSPFMYGWDQWEMYVSGAWPTLPNIQTSGIRVYANGSWSLLNSTYGYQVNLPNGMPYQRLWLSQYDAWSVGP